MISPFDPPVKERKEGKQVKMNIYVGVIVTDKVRDMEDNKRWIRSWMMIKGVVGFQGYGR